MTTTIERLPLDAFHADRLGDTATDADAAAWERVFAAWLAARHPALTLTGSEILAPVGHPAPEEGVWAQFEAEIGDDWWEAVELMRDRGELLPRLRQAVADYTWGNSPDLVPVDWDDNSGLDWDGVCKAAGFDPADEEVGVGRLREEWRGHPAGSIVVSELTVEGHRFAVLEEEEEATDEPASHTTPEDLVSATPVPAWAAGAKAVERTHPGCEDAHDLYRDGRLVGCMYDDGQGYRFAERQAVADLAD